MREHQTSPGDTRPDIDDFTRADIDGGESRRLLVPGSGRRGVSPPRRHEFHLYTVYYPVGGCRNNGAFHVPPRSDEGISRPARPFQVRT